MLVLQVIRRGVQACATWDGFANEVEFCTLVESVKIIVNNHPWDGGHVENEDIFALNIPPSTKTFQYSRLSAFDNPYQVDGDMTICVVTYSYGAVSIFSHKELQMDNVKDYIQYVGLLEDILLMEYGIISLSIIFCDVHG
jgi:hypothetical protein